ncbi:glycosyltransferase [Stutzerimonas nitrititolerans]|uniref:glycosyltransferase n=1 Tax=Stutzerimonas nitrititolerans TaxID=2482751 RepID=UPI0028A736A0|nr:glycosyltransferase [Stutzerimonas nitrititolerans]
MPKVSVMMPAYNAESFISEALDSILSQDYSDFQIVVSDDASTDGTANIIRRYKEKYPDKIIAIFNPVNLGVTANCNLALKHCVGDYVSLFAGDDVMLPGKLSRQVALMNGDPECVLCYHPVEIFDSDTNKTLYVTNQHRGEDVYSTEDLLLKGGIPGGCSIMVRRSAMPEGGYDERLKTVSDWLFFLEISMRGNLRKVDEVLARYRKHVGGASRQTYSLLAESLYALDIFQEKNYVHSGLDALVCQAKARYLAGEAFRQLKDNPRTALRLSAEILDLQQSLKYQVLHLVAWINCYAPGGRFLIGWPIVRFKYFLKRVVG